MGGRRLIAVREAEPAGFTEVSGDSGVGTGAKVLVDPRTWGRRHWVFPVWCLELSLTGPYPKMASKVVRTSKFDELGGK